MGNEFGKDRSEWPGLNLPPGVSYEDLGIPRPPDEAPELEGGNPEVDEDDAEVSPVVYEEGSPANELPPHVMVMPDFLQDRGVSADRQQSSSGVEPYIEEGEIVDATEPAKTELVHIISDKSEGDLREVFQTFAMMLRRSEEVNPTDMRVCLADEVDFATVAAILERGRRPIEAPGQAVNTYHHPLVGTKRQFGVLVDREPPERNYEGLSKLEAWRRRRDDKGWDSVAPKAFYPGPRQMDVLRRATLIQEGDEIAAQNAVLKEQLKQRYRLYRDGILPAGADVFKEFGVGAAMGGMVEISDEDIYGWPDGVREDVIKTLASKLVDTHGSMTPKNPLEFMRGQELYARVTGIHWSKDKPDVDLKIKQAREKLSQEWRLPAPEDTVLVVTGGIAESPGVLPVLVAGLAPHYTDIVVGGNQYHQDTERVLQDMYPGIHCAGASIEYALTADIVVVQGGPMLAANKLLRHIRPGGVGIIPGGPEYDQYREQIIELVNDPIQFPANEFTILDPQPSGVLETEGLTTHDGTAYVHVDGRETMIIVRNEPVKSKRS